MINVVIGQHLMATRALIPLLQPHCRNVRLCVSALGPSLQRSAPGYNCPHLLGMVLCPFSANLPVMISVFLQPPILPSIYGRLIGDVPGPLPAKNRIFVRFVRFREPDALPLNYFRAQPIGRFGFFRAGFAQRIPAV
jgi:hypothetical protein